jgi:ADP-ribosylglycohydrolase
MPIPDDYVERTYAGVLGKLIGVYLGRPFEGWSYERIMAELGEIRGYVHERRGVPLIVTDDDISGTFTFVRALNDYGATLALTAAQIGQTWLNYIIENKTILWWGGMGNSTEHTAFLRLKNGTPAPASGSIALNGKVVAEQIGAQIFIDGWAMLAPGDPELAADLARRAASVSHDGEAIYGAQMLAAMQAQAFVEPDLGALLDTGLALIPRDSVIARMINDIREWRVETPDWRTARELLARDYGYDTYGGNCHIVPNHGLIILSLLYGDDNFDKSLMIVNTCGWDTDCNSGNVGCLLGIKNGLDALSGADWRGPVADRLFLPTADGGRALTDAVGETYRLVNLGRALAGQPPLNPKGGARFHFEAPGSVQGFLPEGALTLENVSGHSTSGTRSLALRAGAGGGRAMTATFIPPDAASMPSYALLASPTLYPGQVLKARLQADPAATAPVTAALCLRVYTSGDALELVEGPHASLTPGATAELTWIMPDTGGEPIAQVGVACSAQATLFLDSLTWDGEPDVVLRRPEQASHMWQRAWVAAIDQAHGRGDEMFRLIQNGGRGLLITGTREWRNYTVSATLTPHMASSFGIAARVQGLRRFYALVLARASDGSTSARLLRALDGDRVLGEVAFVWQFGMPYTLQLAVAGECIQGSIDGRILFNVAVDVADPANALDAGAIALVVEDGRVGAGQVTVRGIAHT